jgi:hypothetical protein
MVKLRIWAISIVAVIGLTVGTWLGADTHAATSRLQELPIVIDANFTPYIQDEATAGTTRVSLVNDTSESFGVSLYLVPDEVLDRLDGDEETAEVDAAGLPLWLGEAKPVGGPGIAGSGSESQAVVDLEPGTYVLVFTFFPLQKGQLPSVLLAFDDGRPFLIDVTGAPASSDTETVEPSGTKPAALPTEDTDNGGDDDDNASDPGDPRGSGDGDPPLTATIVMTDGGFQIPDSFERGPQTWEIVNQGQAPHALIVVAVPDGTTVDQLLTALFPGPDNAVASFDTSAMINVGGLGPLAPGLSAGATFDLVAGTYAMFSALPDPVTGEPDGAQGLLAVFVVRG